MADLLKVGPDRRGVYLEHVGVVAEGELKLELVDVVGVMEGDLEGPHGV